MYLLWAKWTSWKLFRFKLCGQRAAHWAIRALSFDAGHTEDMASQEETHILKETSAPSTTFPLNLIGGKRSSGTDEERKYIRKQGGSQPITNIVPSPTQIL